MCSPQSGRKSRKVIAELDDQKEEEEEEAATSTSKLHLAFQSARTTAPEGPQDMGATATLETETEHDRDARAIMERTDELKKVNAVIVARHTYIAQTHGYTFMLTLYPPFYPPLYPPFYPPLYPLFYPPFY